MHALALTVLACPFWCSIGQCANSHHPNVQSIPAPFLPLPIEARTQAEPFPRILQSSQVRIEIPRLGRGRAILEPLGGFGDVQKTDISASCPSTQKYTKQMFGFVFGFSQVADFRIRFELFDFRICFRIFLNFRIFKSLNTFSDFRISFRSFSIFVVFDFVFEFSEFSDFRVRFRSFSIFGFFEFVFDFSDFADVRVRFLIFEVFDFDEFGIFELDASRRHSKKHVFRILGLRRRSKIQNVRIFESRLHSKVQKTKYFWISDFRIAPAFKNSQIFDLNFFGKAF